MNKILFIKRHNTGGAGDMRGDQISSQLNLLGINSECITYQKLVKLFEDGIKIENTIIVAVKHLDIKLLKRLSENNNKIIIDIIDNFKIIKHLCKEKYEFINGIIFPNKSSYCDFGHLFVKKINLTYIYHHWDPRINPQRMRVKRKDKIAYIGNRININRKEHNLENVIYFFKPKSWLTAANNYIYHLSIRSPESTDFKYKPNTKLSLAAGSNSYIITTKDNSFTELLPADYPFFVSYETNEIQKMINYINSNEARNDRILAKKQLIEVKRETSLEEIIKSYVKFFQEISDYKESVAEIESLGVAESLNDK